MVKLPNHQAAREFAKMTAKLNGHKPGYFRRRWTGDDLPIVYSACKLCGAEMEITDRVQVSGKMIEEVCSHPQDNTVVQNSHDANVVPSTHI